MRSRAHRSLLAGLIVFTLPAAVLAAPSATPAARSTDQAVAALRDDARLEQKVTIERRETNLGALLTDLGKELNVKLSASRDTMDDKVTFYLKDRPAVEGLSLLARHFGFRWFRTGGGYELGQDAESKRREAAFLAGKVEAQLAAIDARMGRVARLASLSAAQLADRQGEINRRLEDPNLAPEDRAALLEEAASIRDVQRPGGDVAAHLYAGLNAAQLAQLRAGDVIRFSTEAGTLPAPLAQEVHAAPTKTPPPGVPRLSTAFGRVQAVPGGLGAPGTNLPPIGAEVTLQISSSGLLRMQGAPPARQFAFRAMLNSIRGNGESRQVLPTPWSPFIAPPREEERPATQTDDPALLKAVELDLSPAAPAAQNDPVLFRALGGLPAGWHSLGKIAAALHEATGLQLLSDSYVRDRIAPERLNVGKGKPRPVVQILDTIAKELNYTWSKEGDLILLRSRIFPEDRVQEVPERVLQPWKSRVSHAGTLTLDDLGDLAAALTDDQAFGMQNYWAWYVEGTSIPAMDGLDGFYGNRNHLRLWASLTRPQRAAAQAGQVVPVSGMSNIQRSAFLRGLMTFPEGYRPDLAGNLNPTPADVAAGGLRLSLVQTQRQAFSGVDANGQKANVVVQRAGAAPPGQGDAPRIAGVDGAAIQLVPAGAPQVMNAFNFLYLLAGNDQPARTGVVVVPRMQERKE